MNAFEFTEYIAAPPDEVFRVLSDPGEAAKFLDNIKESKKLSDGPIGVGTTFRETRLVGGKEATADLTITDFRPDSRLEIGTEAEGITVTYRYDLAVEGEGTRLTWVCELEAGGLRKVMLPMVAGIMKKEDGNHLQKLKAYLEKVAT